MAANSISIRQSYVLDVANFLNVLTGDPFYVDRHPEAYSYWSDRVSEAGREAVRGAVAAWGSAMIGPAVSYALSAIPGFAEMEPAQLGSHLRTIDQHLRGLSDFAADDVEKAQGLCRSLAPVVDELQALGFFAYWTAERLPQIRKAAAAMEQFLNGLSLEINQAVSHFLGYQGTDRSQPIELYLCTFAAPHGIKILGDRFISDVRFEPRVTVRIAIHEMFHPPYRLADIEQEAAALIADPLFQESFRTKDPKYGYNTETGFLEENIVEAMEVHVSRQAGLLDDPIGYLVKHDDGSHRLSVVLLKYFEAIPKETAEPFGDYLKRLVREMPVGRLTREYQEEIAAWQEREP